MRHVLGAAGCTYKSPILTPRSSRAVLLAYCELFVRRSDHDPASPSSPAADRLMASCVPSHAGNCLPQTIVRPGAGYRTL